MFEFIARLWVPGYPSKRRIQMGDGGWRPKDPDPGTDCESCAALGCVCKCYSIECEII